MPWVQIYEAKIMIMIKSRMPKEITMAHPIPQKLD
jgi:hypothetical protein